MILAVQGHDLFIKRFAALTLPRGERIRNVALMMIDRIHSQLVSVVLHFCFSVCFSFTIISLNDKYLLRACYAQGTTINAGGI